MFPLHLGSLLSLHFFSGQTRNDERIRTWGAMASFLANMRPSNILLTAHTLRSMSGSGSFTSAQDPFLRWYGENDRSNVKYP